MKKAGIQHSDDQLVNLIKNGDKRAMSELYLKYYMLVLNKCISFSRNLEEANDLTHDIMLKILENINSFKGESKFSTWLYSVTINYCIDQKRKNKRIYFEPLDKLYDYNDTTLEDLEVQLMKERTSQSAFKVLSDLDSDDQELLMMKYGKNKSIRELQVLYKLSSSAVKMKLMRARRKASNRLKIALSTQAIA